MSENSHDGSEAMMIAMFLLPPPGCGTIGLQWTDGPGTWSEVPPVGLLWGPLHAAPHIQPAGQSELHGPSTIEEKLGLV